MTGADIVGSELPGGTYRVKRWMSFLWADATRNEADRYRYGGSDAETSVAVPPEFATQIAVAGSGASIEGVLRDLGLDWESGVFYAGQELHFEQPLKTGVEYQISGEIGGVERKEGGSGDFLLVTLDYDATDSEGNPVFESIMTIIVR